MAEKRRAFWISCPSPSRAFTYSATVMYVHITDTATITPSAIRGIAIGSTAWRTHSKGVAPRSRALTQYACGTAMIASRTIGIRYTTAPA